jgi:polyisoprenoid-binding protein YceI
MMVRQLFTLLVITLGLFVVPATGSAGEPCSAFEDGRVDPEMLAAMRQAAGEGRLYRIDASVSKVGFCVRHFPFREFRGEFSNVVGGLALPPNSNQYGQALLLIHTSSLRSDSSALVPIVRGSSFMDTAQYPDILYIGRKFEWLTPLHAHIYGELTVRGLTRPVIFDVDIEGLEDEEGDWSQRIRLRGLSHVSRFTFGMLSHRLFVSETIQLCLGVELERWEFPSAADRVTQLQHEPREK